MDPSRAGRNRRWLTVLAVAFVVMGMASRLRPETLAPIIEVRFPDVEPAMTVHPYDQVWGFLLRDELHDER